MAWGGWGGRPSVPSPPLSPESKGMGGGCGPLQSGSSPSIFLEGAEELVAMETEKRQRDAGRYWGQAEIHTLDLRVTCSHTTQVYISQHPWSKV